MSQGRFTTGIGFIDGLVPGQCCRVYPAVPYEVNWLHSGTRVNNMLLKQYQFPDTYDEKLDKVLVVDHEKVLYQDYSRAQNCFLAHTGGKDVLFHKWLKGRSDSGIISFLIDYMRPSDVESWNGYRVLARLISGRPAWTFELFSKHPNSSTEVYSDLIAPNVKCSLTSA